MSQEAFKFKSSNQNLNFKRMSLAELQKLPVHNGLINFKISETSFLILNILNDDSSAVKYFWKDSHDLESLNLWYNITKKRGTYLDVGAHTGLYTLTAMKANRENNVLCFEPSMKGARLEPRLGCAVYPRVDGCILTLHQYNVF